MVFNVTFNNIAVNRGGNFIGRENPDPDAKGVIRIQKSKKDSQHNGQKKNDKRPNNDLQTITYKTKDRVTGIPLKSGRRGVISGWVNSS